MLPRDVFRRAIGAILLAALLPLAGCLGTPDESVGGDCPPADGETPTNATPRLPEELGNDTCGPFERAPAEERAPAPGAPVGAAGDAT